MTVSEYTHASRTRLLDAALYVLRAKGYTATRVEDICEAAGLTKGSFFHHFKNKEDLALAAVEHFSARADRIFASAPYASLPDPLDRLLGYVKFRKSILTGGLPQFTCLLGTMVQEAYETHPQIRQACQTAIDAHAATVEADFAAAMAKYNLCGDGTAKSLALYTQAVLQGAFILAKAHQSAAVAADCIDHLYRYIELLFHPTPIPTHKGDSMTDMNPTIQLTEEPDVMNWPETHYVFIEKTGPFMQTAPQAWQEVHKLIPAIAEHNTITGYISLYKIGPQIYRAGVSVGAPPVDLPPGVAYEKFSGGKYSRFVLTGPYSNLGAATGRAVQLVAEKQIPLRDDYNIENYVNDPRVTPEEKLKTEILFPTA